MRVVLRLVLVVLLVLAGSPPSAFASPRVAPCHDTTAPVAPHHGTAAAVPCAPAHDDHRGCVLPAAICCAVVAPLAEVVAPPVAFDSYAVAWAAVLDDGRAGLRAEPVTPPPRV